MTYIILILWHCFQQGKNDEIDDEAVYDSARLDNSEKDERRKRDQAIKKHSAKEKALENCRFCIGSNNASSDCIVLTKEKVTLSSFMTYWE